VKRDRSEKKLINKGDGKSRTKTRIGEEMRKRKNGLKEGLKAGYSLTNNKRDRSPELTQKNFRGQTPFGR